MRSRLALALLAVAVIAGATLAPTSAPAVVPPRDCGFVKVKGKRYNVKADQLRCADARSHTERYLARRQKPKGYRCDRYEDTALLFRCRKGIREFFAIRR